MYFISPSIFSVHGKSDYLQRYYHREFFRPNLQPPVELMREDQEVWYVSEDDSENTKSTIYRLKKRPGTTLILLTFGQRPGIIGMMENLVR